MTKIYSKLENDNWAKNLKGKMTTACLAIKYQNEVIMVKAGYKDHWTFPSGVVDPNESPLDTAIRESREEIGFCVNKKSCHFLTTIFTYSNDGSRDRFNFVFLTTLKSKDLKINFKDKEITHCKWVKFEDIANMSKNRKSYINIQKYLEGKIKDSYIEVH